MDILKQYTERANEIIGERTPNEEKYDREVIRWIRRGKSVRKAIAKANEKYPTEALQVDNDNMADVQAHYEYLAEHEAIMEKLDALKRQAARGRLAYVPQKVKGDLHLSRWRVEKVAKSVHRGEPIPHIGRW